MTLWWGSVYFLCVEWNYHPQLLCYYYLLIFHHLLCFYVFILAYFPFIAVNMLHLHLDLLSRSFSCHHPSTLWISSSAFSWIWQGLSSTEWKTGICSWRCSSWACAGRWNSLIKPSLSLISVLSSWAGVLVLLSTRSWTFHLHSSSWTRQHVSDASQYSI